MNLDLLPWRFWEKVALDADGCWVWTGCRHQGRWPHGKFGASKGKTVRAHRHVYQTLIAPIPEGWHVHHRCHRPECVNPWHLEAVSPKEHTTRHVRRGRFSGMEVCSKGHPFDRVDPKTGWRKCSICHNETRRKWRERNRERLRKHDREYARRRYARKKTEQMPEKAWDQLKAILR